jgi:hypothetical protein
MIDYCDECCRIYQSYKLELCEYCQNYFCPYCDPHIEHNISCNSYMPATLCSMNDIHMVKFCSMSCKRDYIAGFRCGVVRRRSLFYSSNSDSE